MAPTLSEAPVGINSNPNRSRGSRLIRGLHALIILNFLVEIGYTAYMVFAVVTPDMAGPLGPRALDLPHELMVTRRLYAIECWVAIAGCAIYLAITEIAPRLRRPG